MEVSVSISPSTVQLGQPVTVTFTSTGCANTALNIDNFPAPIELGVGNVSGTIKVLPLTSGQFNIVITGSGRFDMPNDYMPVISDTASCQVN